MKKQYKYLVIDDDMHNNLIVNLIINKYLNPLGVRTFTNAIAGLSYIMDKDNLDNNKEPFVLLLDINMPVMSGWDFLQEFEKLDQEIRDQFIVFMLSSSVDERDFERANKHKLVHGYLIKPLDKEKIIEMLNNEATRQLDNPGKSGELR